MKEGEMKIIAELIARVVKRKESPIKIRKEVESLRRKFKKLQYCFSPGESPFRKTLDPLNPRILDPFFTQCLLKKSLWAGYLPPWLF